MSVINVGLGMESCCPRYLTAGENYPSLKITVFEEPIEAVHLHAFGDTSSEGTCAAVYAVVHQQSGVNQGLVAAKSRLAKKNLTIPRLELVSAHMASTLVDNVKNALSYPVTSVFGWLDSTTALYWIKGKWETATTSSLSRTEQGKSIPRIIFNGDMLGHTRILQTLEAADVSQTTCLSRG
jgi:hypothetical protein